MSIIINLSIVAFPFYILFLLAGIALGFIFFRTWSKENSNKPEKEKDVESEKLKNEFSELEKGFDKKNDY